MKTILFATFCAALLLIAVDTVNAREESAKNAADACGLLSKDDVQKIIGEPLKEPKKGPAPPKDPDVLFSHCTYESTDGLKTLTMSVRDSKKGDNSPGYTKQTMIDGGMKVEDVSGVGDAAFWTLGVNQLQTFKGKNIQVVISVFGFEKPKEKATDLAKKALEKL